MRDKKIVLITGATSGIGKEAAFLLAREGCRVFATGRRTEALEAVAAEAGDLPLETLLLDVNDADSIASAVMEVEERTGGHGLDVLVNNAGYANFAPMAIVTDKEMRGQFETNVFGLVKVTQAFLPAMRARGRGKIINVTSVLGRTTFILQGVYCATKYAVEALTDCLRREVAGFGIHVTPVEPGMIRTNFEDTAAGQITDYADDPVYSKALERYGAQGAEMYKKAPGPLPVARTISKVIRARRPAARYITPFINRIMLFFMNMMPTRLVDFILRKVAGL